MSIPTVMRWDHKNAPQIANMDDWEQIKAWYQAIFVDGYLADDDVTPIPGLGWDFSYDDATHYVYLWADTGADQGLVNRMYINIEYQDIFDASDDWGGDANVFENEGGLRIGEYGDGLEYGLPTFFNNNKGTDRHCPWIIIGNNRGWYILGGYNGNISTSSAEHPPFSSSSDYSTWHYFGDFINDGIDYGKNNQTCSWGYWANWANTATNPYTFNRLNSLADWLLTSRYSKIMTYDYGAGVECHGMHINRTITGQNAGLNHTATPFMYQSGSLYAGALAIHDLPYPYIDGSLKILPYDLWVRTPLDAPIGQDRETVYIGKMPGLYIPMHYRPLSTSQSLVEFEGTGEFEGQHFIGLARSGADEIYINITADWGI